MSNTEKVLSDILKVSKMELRHLRYFIAVADELHFRRAAKKLNIAQPPLSQQIKKLEEELGVALFLREKRRVTLTDAGLAFRTRARAILEASDRAADEARQIGRGQIGRLVIGYMSAATLTHLPRVLSKFRVNFPDADIELLQVTSGEQLVEVAAGRLDIGFVSIRPAKQPFTVNGVDLVLETAWHEMLAVALSPSNKLAAADELALGDLSRETFIGFPRTAHTGYFDQVIELCLRAGFSPHIHQQVTALPSALALIAANYGVGLMPLSLYPAWHEMVSFVPLRERPAIAVNAITRRHNHSPVLTAFMDSLRVAG